MTDSLFYLFKLYALLNYTPLYDIREKQWNCPQLQDKYHQIITSCLWSGKQILSVLGISFFSLQLFYMA